MSVSLGQRSAVAERLRDFQYDACRAVRAHRRSGNFPDLAQLGAQVRDAEKGNIFPVVGVR